MAARSILIALVVCVAVAGASAQPAAPAEAPDPKIAAIQEAFDAGRFGDMYQQATALAQERPDDAWTRYLAALAAMRTARYAEAMQQVDAGLAKHPDETDLLGLRAAILLAQGDEKAAKVEARRAIALSADAADARDTLDEIELGDRARERRSGEPAGLPPGSAAAFVDGVIEQIASQRSSSAIAAAFDPEILSSIPGPPPPSSAMGDVITGALEQARAASAQGGQRFIGWVVSPEMRDEGGRTWVDVHVPIESTFTSTQRRAIEVALADPKTRGVISPQVLSIIEGVPSDERAALLDRLVGTRSRAVLELAFETRKAGDAWKITDVQANGVSMKAQLANYSEVMERVDPSKRKSGAYRAGEAVGRLLILLLVAGVIVWLVRRGRRRT